MGRALAVVLVLVIGAFLLSFSAAKKRVVERGKMSEGIAYIDDLRQAQESYFKRHGRFAVDLKELDQPERTLKYFDAGPIEILHGRSNGWSIRLSRRTQDKSSGYGPYTLTYDSSAPKPLICQGEGEACTAPFKDSGSPFESERAE